MMTVKKPFASASQLQGWMRLGGIALVLSAYGETIAFGDSRPILAVLPPTIKTQQAAKQTDREFSPADMTGRVILRFAKEADKKKWPFDVMPPRDIEAAYLGIIGNTHSDRDDIAFKQLRPLADRIGARYLLHFTINELVSYRKNNTIQRMTNARANIEMYIYDRDADAFVWQDSNIASSSRADFADLASLSERQDQALLNALLRTTEPFAQGARKQIARPVLKVVANVQKLLADGTRVLLDIGQDKGINAGDIFVSIESDAKVIIEEVLANGAIAVVTKGTPKEKETFKSL